MKDKKIIRRKTVEQKTDFSSSVSPLLQQVYVNRGVYSDTELKKELAGLPSPDLFKGMPEAVDALVHALEQQQKVTVVGDFDADGATSSALAVLALRAMGYKHVSFLVPNRFEYGYGLTPEIVDEAHRLEQPDLIITVDNGISSIDGALRAKELGITVVVTDHHLPGRECPDVTAIVNPNQQGCEFPTKNIAGVGVIFYVMSALRKRLRENHYFSKQKIDEPNMADYLDLVALGTVADVVALDYYNRILIQQGLLRIRGGKTRPGIMALIDIAKRNSQRLVASDMGFSIAPRLNAAGRMDDMSIGIECLMTEDAHQARELAQQLDTFNRDRRAVETGMKNEALKSLEELHLEEGELPWGLCVFDESWHQGVIGILASRLKERYHRPTIVFALSETIENKREDIKEGKEETVKGSARSLPGFHIRDALDAIATANPKMLEKFGGHAMAAGMSLPKSQLENFIKAFDEQVRKELTKDDLTEVILSDGELSAEDFSLEVANQLREGGPWGQKFPEPLFDGEFKVVQKRVLNGGHLKLVLLPLVMTGEQVVDAIAFNVDEELQEAVQEGALIKAAYRLDVNEFRGRQSLQLMVESLGV